MFRQKELAEWQKKNFSKGETGNCDACVFRLLTGMTEELGELSHALLKYHQGIRGITEEQMKEQVADAFGDINVYGTQLLSVLGINAQEAVEQTVDEILKRDWSKDKVTGGTESCHKGGEHEWIHVYNIRFLSFINRTLYTEVQNGNIIKKTCMKCGLIALREE